MEGTISRRTRGGRAEYVGRLPLHGFRVRAPASGGESIVYVVRRTQAEVRRARDEARIARDRGLPVGHDGSTIRQFLGYWLDERLSVGSPNTYDSYESTVRLHIAPRIGHIELRRLSVSDVDRMVAELGETRLSPPRSATR